MRNVLIAIFIAHILSYATAQPLPAYKTVVLSKGKIPFRLRPADTDEYARSCPRNICSCESDIQYIRLLAPSTSNALNSINRKLFSDASAVRCRYLDAADSVHQAITHLSARFISVVERFWSQQLETGGSCHGSSAVHTFDLTSGKEYVLVDIVSGSSLGRLRSGLAASIVAEHARQLSERLYEEFKANSPTNDAPSYRFKAYVEPLEEFERDLKLAQRAVESMDDQQLAAATFFIEKGRVFIDVEGYYLSCAGGSFHPAEIPVSLITSAAIRQEIAGDPLQQ